jgi:hypothetical protein
MFNCPAPPLPSPSPDTHARADLRVSWSKPQDGAPPPQPHYVRNTGDAAKNRDVHRVNSVFDKSQPSVPSDSVWVTYPKDKRTRRIIDSTAALVKA